MKHTRKLPEGGQSLVLMVLLLFAFMGMLALALDAGYGVYQRRVAQNAADAGALAGANVYCPNRSDPSQGALVVSTAEEYATRNASQHAVNVSVTDPYQNNGTVRVEVEITFDSFFAGVLGQETITSAASASARCFSPGLGTGVLPVVWSCRPPINNILSDSEDCQQQRITWDVLQEYLNESGPNYSANCDASGVCDELYVIMDSLTYADDIVCIQDSPTGTINCDFDDPPDGEADFLASGGRSWSDLDGNIFDCEGRSEGASELSEWILNGYPCEITAHTWLSAQSGVAASIYDTVEDRMETNPLVLVPVFDMFCPGDPVTHPGCTYHSSDDTVNYLTGNSEYFHTVAFAAFYITCVNQVNVKTHLDQACPGMRRAWELNQAMFNGTIRSIEGYFLEGYIPGLEGRGEYDIDTGVYTIYLTE